MMHVGNDDDFQVVHRSCEWTLITESELSARVVPHVLITPAGGDATRSGDDEMILLAQEDPRGSSSDHVAN
jgi:hypothetical protein